jgi:16S rRNA (adenine1518-N6/adenine1519-N6)-dimethyltransferase
MSILHPKKKLGQHWLRDQDVLEAIADDADIQFGDHVLEIGPGEGYLTRTLLERGANVTALEFDPDAIEHIQSSKKFAKYFVGSLERHPAEGRDPSKHCTDNELSTCSSGELSVIAASEPQPTDEGKEDSGLRVKPAMTHAGSLTLLPGDIRSFDYSTLPKNYKLCANIPYYLTANLLSALGKAENKPAQAALLVQDEVASRYAAPVGETKGSLSVFLEIFFERKVGTYVPRSLFVPPPKVDSRVIILVKRPTPLIKNEHITNFEKMLKFGFISPRKLLKKNLSVGYQLPPTHFSDVFTKLNINPLARAEALSMQDWVGLFGEINK